MTGPTALSMEDIEKELTETKPADLTAIKLEGDTVPEEFRGKTAAELVAMAKATSDALRTSEEARKAQPAPAAPQPVIVQAPAAPKEEPLLTKEQLAELFETDPIGAVAYMQEKAVKEAEANIEKRFSGLTHGSMSMAEQSAKSRFADEFALFGDDIKRITNAMLDKTALGSVEGWENVISYVRGRPGNFEKYIEHKTKVNAEAAAAAARAEQEKLVGFQPRPAAGVGPSSPAPGAQSSEGLDETEQKIADGFIAQGVFKTRAEYKKWRDM